MVKHLHTDFLSDGARFDAAAAYWQRLCSEVLRAHGQEDRWQPWFGIHLDRSQLIVEEGSIHSLYSEVQNKAISIEQYPAKEDNIEIWARLGTFGEGVLEPPTSFMLLGCALSEEAANIARKLIELWVRPDTTTEQMEAAIAQLIPWNG